jgi:diaminohydroxyphosphoribosylaminopyrimidine deaminase / 5-amino-6-(5-phosphoribosylamino)uracil reductase
MQDPNPRVAGQGFAKLRAAGIKVEIGLFEVEARKLNESFAKYIRLGKPLVTLKSAMTLDGKIADATNRARSTGRWLGHSYVRGRAQRIPLDHGRGGARACAATAPSE